MEKSIKSFVIPAEAWYKDTVYGNSEICIGFYYENGGGTDGEFTITWEGSNIQLNIYDDSWKVLSEMPELVGLMAEISRKKMKPTITEFAGMLKEIGFKDITKRERNR